MKKEKIIQISFIAIVAIIGIIAIYFIVSGQNANDDIQYPYVTTADGQTVGDSLSSTVQKIAKIEGPQAAYNFNYDLTQKPPIFAIDHPFMGLNCNYIEYKTELKGDTLVIDESQAGDCNEPQPFYVTTLFTESRQFSKVQLNQSVNGEITATKDFQINPEVPKTEQSKPKNAIMEFQEKFRKILRKF